MGAGTSARPSTRKCILSTQTSALGTPLTLQSSLPCSRRWLQTSCPSHYFRHLFGHNVLCCLLAVYHFLLPVMAITGTGLKAALVMNGIEDSLMVSVGSSHDHGHEVRPAGAA